MQLKLLSVVLVVSSAFVAQALPAKRDLPGQILRLDASQVEVPNLFSTWALQHDKNYTTAEREARQQVYTSNLDFVNKHNSEDHSYTVSLNEYADLTWEEFRSVKLGLQPGHDGSFRSCSCTVN